MALLENPLPGELTASNSSETKPPAIEPSPDCTQHYDWQQHTKLAGPK